MTGFNQKGPEGLGPMTGRRLGRCTQFGAGAEQTSSSRTNKFTEEWKAFMSTCGLGRGMGSGGRGRGCRQRRRFRGGQ